VAEVTIRVLGSGDAAVLERLAPEVFDNPIDAEWTAEFFADPRHHLAVAIDECGTVVGIASGVRYVHPDKPPELFVNEIGVTPEFRRRGIGRRLLSALFECARALGCQEAWLGTDADNAAARRLYAAVGGMERPMLLVGFSLE
jgi:ribosomal protein S18 acetylase RimI-like enzyme